MINGDHINKSNKYVTQELNVEIKIDEEDQDIILLESGFELRMF